MFDFIHNNPMVYFQDCKITNDPRIISRNPKATAINSAIEVDITGQVCADSIGEKMFSGVGGQNDFEEGAGMSKGGMPIITLPSLTKTGESRIVNTLKRGAGVTTSRQAAHWIATEYGAVNLFGQNLFERAKKLISIAHPNHRERLAKEASDRWKHVIEI